MDTGTQTLSWMVAEAVGERAKVIDVNHWRPNVPWAAVQAAGFGFGIAKATEDIAFVDSTYAVNVAEMEKRGILHGSFHYFRGTFDPAEQVQHYYNIAKGTQWPPIVDVERRNNVNLSQVPLVAPSIFTARLKAFLNEAEYLFKRKPWIYTSYYSWKVLTNLPAWAAEYPLWVANYGVISPLLPAGWMSWDLWQWTSAYQIAGRGFDANWYNGTAADLRARLGVAQPVTLEQRVVDLEKRVDALEDRLTVLDGLLA